MLAKGVGTVPEGDGWLYEPKWDGFRVLIFRDGDEVELQSRVLKPLFRYFPELGPPIRDQLPTRCVVDGELVILGPKGLDFGALQMRLHPAASRIEKLAAEIPARVIAWDLLAIGDEDLTDTPFGARRSRLAELATTWSTPLHLTPATEDPDVARDWFARFEGAGLDGVIAKRLDGVYEPGKRAMRKIKRDRTIDCALVGFRWHKHGPGELVGSLILGLYDEAGRLHQLGVASSFTKARRLALAQELAPLRENALDDHPWREWMDAEPTRRAGMTSRWNAGRDLSWEPLRIERVAEVACNQVDRGKLRHPARFVRWRPDRDPQSCGFDQLEGRPADELSELFGQSPSAAS